MLIEHVVLNNACVLDLVEDYVIDNLAMFFNVNIWVIAQHNIIWSANHISAIAMNFDVHPIRLPLSPAHSSFLLTTQIIWYVVCYAKELVVSTITVVAVWVFLQRNLNRKFDFLVGLVLFLFSLSIKNH